MARKFIINNGYLRLANVELHRELARDHSTTKGGGHFHVDIENKKVYLYGKSCDYGKAKIADISEAIKRGNFTASLDEYTFYYWDTDDMNEAIKNGVLLLQNT